jgi:hypothetical protein
MLTTPSTSPHQPPAAPRWEIADNNAALWQITITSFATGATTTHYLIVVGDVFNHQDVCDLYYDRCATLAAALNLPAEMGTNFALVGMLYLGLVNMIG